MERGKPCIWKNGEIGIAEKIDKIWKEDLDSIRINRVKNDLETDIIPIREVTRMLRNTEGWKMSKKELETKPRKNEK